MSITKFNFPIHKNKNIFPELIKFPELVIINIENITMYELIEQIARHYITTYYKKIIKKYPQKIIPPEFIKCNVTMYYNELEREAKEYIKMALKNIIGDKYNGCNEYTKNMYDIINNIFNNRNNSIEIITNEIIKYQL